MAELNQTDASDRFAATGLSHLIAVSGSHLALIAAFVERLMARTRLTRGARFGIIGALSIAYVLFTGGAASAVRSVAMVCLTMFAQGGRRRAHGISALCLTTIGFVALNPASSTTWAFSCRRQACCSSQCSAAPSPGTWRAWAARAPSARRCRSPWRRSGHAAAHHPRLRHPFAHRAGGEPRRGAAHERASSVRHRSGAAVRAGAVLAPLMTVPEGIANASIFAARLLASVPLASIPVALDGLSLALPYVLAVACYLLWPVPSRRAFAGALVAAVSACAGWLVFWLFFAPAGITVLDVGQADAIWCATALGACWSTRVLTMPWSMRSPETTCSSLTRWSSPIGTATIGEGCPMCSML